MAKLCLFSALITPSVGGVEFFTEHLANELSVLGHEVTVISCNTHGGPEQETWRSGVSVIRLPCIALMGGRFPIPRYNSAFKLLWSELCDMTFDSVIVNTRFYVHSILGVRFARSCNLKPILIEHGSAYLTYGNPLVDWMIARYEDLVTGYLKHLSVRFYGVSIQSVEWLKHFGIEATGVIPNAIDAEAFRLSSSGRDFRHEFGIPKNATIVTFTGRLVPEKGIAHVVHAARQICLNNQNVFFLVAGDGPLFDMVVAECEVNPGLIILGKISQRDIAALLLQSDVFIMPSRSEGFCSSLLEAAVCGVPIVSTDVGIAKQLIPDLRFGMVLESMSSDGFAQAILDVIRQSDCILNRREMIAERAQSLFSWRKSAEAALAATAGS